jgi:hypothetical protein
MALVSSCDAVNEILTRETGRIALPIYNKVVKQGPWIPLTMRGTWPDGMGVIINNMMFERSLPLQTETESWANVSPSDGVTIDSCLQDPEVLQFGQTLRSMQLQRIIKHSPDLCLEDLRYEWEVQQQLENVKRNLTTVTKWVWENRDRNEYTRLAQFKVTEGPQAAWNPFTTSFDPTNPPVSRLLQGTLDTIYMWLAADGAGEDALGHSDGGAPIFGLITDMNTSLDLITQNGDTRSDMRFAYADTLIAPLGEPRAFRGFKHLIDLFPARWNLTGGAFVRVPPFQAPTSTTKGVAFNLDPNYVFAQYQDSVIHVKSVYRQLVPSPITSPGGSTKFNPVDYMGNFAWKNILHKTCNPDGTIGFFRAIYVSASEPGHTEWGFVIRHKSCPPIRLLEPSCYS